MSSLLELQLSSWGDACGARNREQLPEKQELLQRPWVLTVEIAHK